MFLLCSDHPKDFNNAAGMSHYAKSTPPPIPGKARLRLLPIFALVGIVLIPPLLLGIWYINLRTSNASAIRRLEQEIRQRGEPVTLAELQTNYPAIPDEENAAVALMEIWHEDDPEFWNAFKAGASTLPERHNVVHDPALPYLGSNGRKVPRNQPLSSAALAAAESFLSTNAARFEAVRAALKRPRFRFPIKFEDGPAARVPHLARLRSETRNFQVAALAASERGENTKALQALEDIARTGQVLTDEPVELSQLVRIACLNLALESTEQLLSRQSLQPDQLDRLRTLFELSSLRGVAKSTLIYERPFALSSFDPQIAANSVFNSAPEDAEENTEETAANIRKGFRIMQSVGYLDSDRKLMLETFREAIVLAEQETPESLKKSESLFDKANIKARKFPPKLFSSMLLPSVRGVPSNFATYEARRRAALTAIAIERFRLAHGGELPDQLGALVPTFLPNVPEDPFDGEKLRFAKLDRGYVVYSVGRDREDNNGTERTRGSWQKTDVTFTVER